MQHIFTRYVGQRHIAVVGQIDDACVGARVDVVAARLHQPQVQREPKLVALNIHKTVAVEQSVNLHQPPQVAGGHNGVRLLLQQVVDTLTQSAHVLNEIALLEVLFAVLYRHDAHCVGSEGHGTIDRTHDQRLLRASHIGDALHVVAALHLRRFGWHGAAGHSWSWSRLALSEEIEI